ncbi:N-acetylmuramoyl-L-alanine amidase [Brevibacillus dissolubilis]|uniref:N-acetylmuramoyl-L-alanine amidase n=1 Tax=Brevibacillus dissolubilis TaxID=1844116 RepID=UPI00159BBB57|nr:N-acetylmuramoyl-L-alanine amidase [Brevibacillus dissolubilis]
MGVEFIPDLIPQGANNRPGTPLHPTYITIHNTENTRRGANARSHAEYLKGQEAVQRNISWHFTVDDKEAVQSLLTNEVGWHTGSSTGDQQSIGIEICEHEDCNFEKAVANTVELVRDLMKQFDIPITNVVPHKHWDGKNCPRRLLAKWDSFIQQIQADDRMKPEQQQEQPPTQAQSQQQEQPPEQARLEAGCYGHKVRDLQQMLQAGGFDCGPMDGYYGPRTEAAVRNLQQLNGLKTDGVVGPNTWKKLELLKDPTVYTIQMQPGETLAGISKRYRVDMAELIRLNPEIANHQLVPKRLTLRIPMQ